MNAASAWVGFADLLRAGHLVPQWAADFRLGSRSPYFGYHHPLFFARRSPSTRDRDLRRRRLAAGVPHRGGAPRLLGYDAEKIAALRAAKALG